MAARPRTPGRRACTINFLAAGLDGEILLRFGNFRLARVAVLSNQVTGKAGEVVVFDIALTSLTYFDHFAGAGKMIMGLIYRLFTGCYRPLYSIVKPPPLAVTQKRLKLASAPKLSAMLVHLFQVFK
jgi:hypothetical protein